MSQSSLLDKALTVFNSLRRRTSIRDSLRSFGSSSSTGASSIRSKNKIRRSSSYYPYAVYEQYTMFPTIMRDADATSKLLDAIVDAPNGKRALSRLARTCRALAEPALNVLWRELDSLVPIIGLFPAHLLKKARRPGLGLVSLANVNLMSFPLTLPSLPGQSTVG